MRAGGRRTDRPVRIGLALVLGSVLGVTGCAENCPQTASPIAIPSPADPPDRTVTAYLAAVNAHDAERMEDLSTPEFAELTRSIRCDWTVDNVTIVGVSEDRDPRGRFRDVVNVGVLFDLRRQHETPDTPSGPKGRSYWLGRDDPAERWLIYDSGNG
ncbi:hypothetical protein [Herbidospora cretacea]|uniref:hypothetical protein n=1 Tax=Herbidospora cretacea TaxID=28444 RepID=UPI000774218C|nr:hypothetical protein [Herbidospora cretacea]